MKYFTKFLRDQRGVSPVIGVVLMVAVTVVMGAVVAGFAYGYLGTSTKAPSVTITVLDNPADTSSILLKHSGGESIGADEWECSITAGKETSANFSDQTQTGNEPISTGTTLEVTQETDGSTAITAGWYHVVIVHKGSDAILLDTNVKVE